jgi:NADH-quinone oxidoreductase subunit N
VNIDTQFHLMIPEFIVLAAAILCLIVDGMTHTPGDRSARKDPRGVTMSIAVFGCVLAVVTIGLQLYLGSLQPACADCTVAPWLEPGVTYTSFGGLFVLDPFALFFKVVLLIGAALSLLLSDSWLRDRNLSTGAPYALLLFSTSGMMYLVSAGDMITLFLGLEVMSVPLYCLAATLRWDDRSVEAGMKYLVLGAMATAIFLMGVGLLYGFQGLEGGGVNSEISALRSALLSTPTTALPAYASIGGLLVLVGLLFKVSAAPFHMWTPDVYEGTPTPFTAFMSVAVKAAGAAVIIRLFGGEVLARLGLQELLWFVAALTMIVGNFMALVQNNIKRMLAYSSIAHGGYILVAVLAGTADGQAAVLYYALAYTVGNLAAFSVLVYLGGQGLDVETFDDLRGLGARYPWVGAVMGIAMLSLAGMPPLVGFFAKFSIFVAAIAEGYVWLTVIGLLTSAVSFAYYLRPMIVMFMRSEGSAVISRSMDRRLALGMALSTAAIVALGVFTEAWMRLAEAAVIVFAG